MGEWRAYRFNRVVAESRDGDWGPEEASRGLTRFDIIRGTDFDAVRRGDVSGVPVRYLPESTSWRRVLRPDDILLETAGGSSKRPTGRSLLVSDRTLQQFTGPVTCASFARFIRVDSTVAHPAYVFYFLQLLYLSGAMWNHQVQHTGVARFQYTRFADVQEIVLPTLREQRSIAEVLGALDDKIALNEQIADTARSLCRATMEAVWHAERITSLTDRDVALPAEWQRTNLGRLCAAGGGAIQTGPFGSQLHASDYVESGIPSVMPQNIGDNVISEDGIARITAVDALRLSKYLLAEGDIVYSRRGDVKRRALVRSHEEGWLCGTGCLRVRVGTAASPLFISYYLGEPEIQDWIAQHAVGATMPNLNTSILSEVPVILPPSRVTATAEERLAALDASAAHVTHENRTLTELRDTLLPQLVTGKLRVKDAVRRVEEVV